jgi:heparosan-N-sulfate-glucuronate 5-epimerase
VKSAVRRVAQPVGRFVPGDPRSGYYNDLTVKARELGTPRDALREAVRLTSERRRLVPVTVAQLGLAAWTLGLSNQEWSMVAADVAERLATLLDSDGRLPYLFDFPHTYPVRAPWSSAMAQGEIVSLLVRVGAETGSDALMGAAALAAGPLLDPASELLTRTPQGLVLQEYPTEPVSHVLNGWIFALWGLHDVAALAQHTAAASAFAEGTRTLVRRIGLYETGRGWSRYDLYPHPLVHVAAPFYHQLHVAQLEATADLTGEETLRRTAQLWAAGARRPTTYLWAVGRKVAFRLARPRGRRA